MRHLIYLYILAVIVAGCATAKTSTNELTIAKAEQSLIKGKTTKTEVIKIFGEPDMVTKDTRMEGVVECWIYAKYSAEYGSNWKNTLILFGFRPPTPMRGFNLMLYFDDKEILKDYSITKIQY